MSAPGGVVHVTYDGLLEPLGATQVVPYVEALAARGFALAVLSFEKPADIEDRGRLEAMADRLHAVGVPWVRCAYHARPSLPATALDVAAGVRALGRIGGGARPGGLTPARPARSGARTRPAESAAPPALIHARSYVAGVMGLLSRRRTGARLLLDMRGFWVDERLESGRWTPGSPAVHVGRRVERDLLAGSDHLVHLTRRGAEGVHRLAPGRRLPPGTVIPTCVDLRRFRPAADPGALRRDLGLPQGPVVVHSGTLSGWYLGEATVRAGAEVARRTGGTFLLLTREEALARRLLERVGAAGVVRSARPEEVPRWLAAADAGLALVRTGFAKSASAPTKVAEYLACGLAVAATAVGDLESQLGGSGVAFTVADDAAPAGIARRLADAMARPRRREEAARLAAAHFSLEEGVGRYAAVYRGLGVHPCA